MTKLWFRTKNDQIVDLNTCSSFWMERGRIVFAAHPDCPCDPLGDFDTKEEAQAYLDEIYQVLTRHKKDCVSQNEIHDTKRNTRHKTRLVEIMSEWIKCSERLPDNHEVVLVSDGLNITVAQVFYNINDDFSWQIKRNKYDLWSDDGYEISHWMPLPEAPND